MIREHVLLESSLSSEGFLTFGTDKDLVGRVNFPQMPSQSVLGGKGQVTLWALTLVIFSVDSGSVMLHSCAGELLPALRAGVPRLGVSVRDVDPKAGLVGHSLVAMRTDD